MSRSFFDFFPPPKILAPSVVGLSIADDAIRIVEYRAKYGKLSLKTSAEYPLAKGIVVDGVVADRAKLVEVLKKAAKEQKIESCVLALPEEKSFVYTTMIKISDGATPISKDVLRLLDKNPKVFLRPAAEGTLAANIPFSAKDVVFDFTLINLDKKNLTAEIVIFALPLDIANGYVESLSQAGISAMSFETESQAVARSVVPYGRKDTYLLLYFMMYKAVIAIVSDGTIFYASTLTHGSGDNTPLEIPAVKDELVKVVSYWHSENSVKMREKSKIQSVIVAGKVDKFLDLPDYISKNLQLPSHMANVWQNAFSLNEIVPGISFEKSLVFASASGAALLPFFDDK